MLASRQSVKSLLDMNVEHKSINCLANIGTNVVNGEYDVYVHILTYSFYCSSV